MPRLTDCGVPPLHLPQFPKEELTILARIPVALFAFVLTSSSAFAINVNWVLDFTATYQGGDTLTFSGSFTYDADMDIFTDIGIARSDGRFYDEDMRGISRPFGGIVGHFFGTDGPGDDLTGAMGIYFTAPLTNAGGLLTFPEFSVPNGIGCGNADCTAAYFEDLFLAGNVTFEGTLTGTPVADGTIPLPATALLLGTALLGMG